MQVVLAINPGSQRPLESLWKGFSKGFSKGFRLSSAFGTLRHIDTALRGTATRPRILEPTQAPEGLNACLPLSVQRPAGATPLKCSWNALKKALKRRLSVA